MLKTGSPWEYLPQEIGCRSGMTCWRRLKEWDDARVWDRLHQLFLDELDEAGGIDWSRAAVDNSHVRAKGGARKPVSVQSTGVARAANIT